MIFIVDVIHIWKSQNSERWFFSRSQNNELVDLLWILSWWIEFKNSSTICWIVFVMAFFLTEDERVYFSHFCRKEQRSVHLSEPVIQRRRVVFLLYVFSFFLYVFVIFFWIPFILLYVLCFFSCSNACCLRLSYICNFLSSWHLIQSNTETQ